MSTLQIKEKKKNLTLNLNYNVLTKSDSEDNTYVKSRREKIY